MQVTLHYPYQGEGEYVADSGYGKSMSYTLPTHVSERENFWLKITPRFRVGFAGLVLTPKSSMGNIERNLFHCHSFPIIRNSVLFSAAAESLDAKRHIQLAVISIEMVRDSVSTDHATHWSGVEGEKHRT